eukprot:2273658-Rhodomonas_salina.3
MGVLGARGRGEEAYGPAGAALVVPRREYGWWYEACTRRLIGFDGAAQAAAQVEVLRAQIKHNNPPLQRLCTSSAVLTARMLLPGIAAAAEGSKRPLLGAPLPYHSWENRGRA